MFIKGRFFIVLLTLLFFTSLHPTFNLNAQSSASINELQIPLRFTWNENESVLFYLVLIERVQNEWFMQVLREITYNSYIDVSLLPGLYRYQITPYFSLNNPGQQSEWFYTEVKPAVRPEVYDVSPRGFNFNIENEFILNIHGRNIDENAIIDLRRPGNLSIIPRETQISEDGSNARLVFEKGQLNAIIYELYVHNPGFETRAGTINFIQQSALTAGQPEPAGIVEFRPVAAASQPEPPMPQQPIQIDTPLTQISRVEEPAEPAPVEPISMEPVGPNPNWQSEIIAQEPFDSVIHLDLSEETEYKKVDFFFSTLWMPQFFLLERESKYYTRDPILAGAGLRIGIVSANPEKLNFGGEFSGIWNTYNSNHTFTAGINFLLQKWFSDNTIALRFRVGAAYSHLFDGESSFDFFNLDSFSLNTGFSILWQIKGIVYMETGLDYSHILTNNPPGVDFLRPWIGISLRF